MALIYKVLSSMDIEIQRQEAIAKNLAGAPVPGFKGESVISSDFDGYLNQYSETGQGTVYNENSIDFNKGPVKHTGRNLDFAIGNEGFFEVTNSKGESFYTRNGRFTLSNSGELITGEGYKVSGRNGDLAFGANDNMNEIEIGSDGTISVGGNTIGALKVVEFANIDNLQRLSGSYFTLKNGHQNEVAEIDPLKVRVMGRTLEESNISIVKEMISMIDSMRKYEMSSKLLKMTDGLRSKELSTFGG